MSAADVRDSRAFLRKVGVRLVKMGGPQVWDAAGLRYALVKRPVGGARLLIFHGAVRIPHPDLKVGAGAVRRPSELLLQRQRQASGS